MTHRLCFALVALLLAAAGIRDGVERWVRTTVLAPIVSETSVEIHDRNGVLLRAYPVEDGIWRLATTPQDVDPAYLDLLIQTEDKRFHQHSGVDILALMRATVQAIRHGRVVSGGSTLTMQTARLLENSGTGQMRGKLRQIRVALALERRLDKQAILALYLTHAPFGANVEGVRAASRAWFGKPATRLTATEAALLVALPQAPAHRRPDRHPEAAQAAVSRILARAGRGALNPRDLPQRLRPFPAGAPHLADLVMRDLPPGSEPLRLTVEARVQRRVEALVARAAADLPAQATAAALVVEHASGEVLAYVGGAGYGQARAHGFVDMVQAQRSPGSTLKPLIYALAMDQGLVHPETLITDAPVAFGHYSPTNFDNVFRGDVSVRQALEMSLNIPPVLLTEAMGPARLMQALERSGAAPRLAGGTPGLAIALGGVSLSLGELVQLYAGLADGGTARPLVWHEAAEDEQPVPRLVSRAAAWQVGHILAGAAPPQGQRRSRIAYKTGTSYGHRDAWAIGYDGRFVIGLWLGRPDGTPIPGMFGGEAAAPYLFEAFDRLGTMQRDLPPPPPETLLVPHALLPDHLKRFRTPGAATGAEDGPHVVFPPEGARIRTTDAGGLFLKLRGGRPPFAILANGAPLRTKVAAREILLEELGFGFSTLRIVDAAGRSDAVSVRLD